MPKEIKTFTQSLSLFLLAVLGLGGLPVALAGPESGSGSADFPAVNLGSNRRGPAAVAALGTALPGVARAYGLRPDELRLLLLTDGASAVDGKGRLHYTDPGAQGAATVNGSTSTSVSVPLADTFLLHSRPGAKRIIYLDFNGHVLSGTAWNSGYNGGADIVAPPYDLDGNPASFNDTERTRIQQIWRRVAEDYSPFEVDVTTELTDESQITRSSTSDEYFGTRVLISPISSYFGYYGGIAYVGAFDDVGDFYKPALVFPENLGGGGEKYVGEACSHETGHNLGLSHDGTTTGTTYYAGQGSGETGWAPIMGNSYNKNVTQWSRGEYAGANNVQDDLAVMLTYGMSYRADDYGDTAATAGYFPAGTQLSAGGLIERNTDADVLAFTTGAGNISLNIAAASPGPNLDVSAELRDIGGALLASSNPASTLGASFNLSVPAGTYFLTVRGSGAGDPLTTGYSAYASLGEYNVTGTVVDPSGSVPPVAVVNATPTAGTGPLVAQFDGSGSFDQDGSLTSYVWDFGDGTSGSGATVSHTYSSAGTYTATLTVADNHGLTGSSPLAIQVLAPNLPPVASATATPTSGVAPLLVTLNGSASSDPDGSLVSHAWNFGDGTSGSGAVVSHTYQSAGTYTATLTVTDNSGATASTSVVIQSTVNPANVIRVQAIGLSLLSPTGAGKAVRAVVKVTTPSGVPVAGVTVTGQWSGPVTGTISALTDANGNATLDCKRFKKSGTVGFTVSKLVKTGMTYDATQNVLTSASIAAP